MAFVRIDFEDIFFPYSGDISVGLSLADIEVQSYLSGITPNWLKKIEQEIDSGKAGDRFIFCLRLLRIASQIYRDIGGKRLSDIEFYDIAEKAFEYCGIDDRETKLLTDSRIRMLSRGRFYNRAVKDGLISLTEQSLIPGDIIQLTPKGRRYLDKLELDDLPEVRVEPRNFEVISFRVIFTFDHRNELIGLTVDGKQKSISGEFSAGKTLLLMLWSTPGRKLEKSVFDKKYGGNYRRKGKAQLQDKIGMQVFDSVYFDNGRTDKWITLSNLVNITMLSKD